MSFKENLKDELIYQDIKAIELAHDIKIPYSTLMSYLNKQKCLPNVEIGVKIAKRLNVSVEYLVTGSDIELNLIYSDINPILKEIQSLPKKYRVKVSDYVHFLYELSKKELL